VSALGAGDVLHGTYRIERLLSRGPRAELYVVAHTRLPRRFALKLLHLPPAQRPAFAAQAARLGRLRHPHIVEVIDWNQTPSGEPYLVMELLDGEDLGAFLRRKSTLSKQVALTLAAQLGAAISAAHRAGVVHGDLKPSQVVLLRRGPLPRFIKVLDFGLAETATPVGEYEDQRALADLLHTLFARCPSVDTSQALQKPALAAVQKRRILTAAVVAGLALCSAAWALIVFL
jgi:serine/threonine protein kinase